MKVAIGADHRGFQMKSFLMQVKDINGKKIDWVDVGSFDSERSDYPIFAKAVAKLVQKKEVEIGVLICGSGIGVAIAANRFKGIYAGVCLNKEIAKDAKEHDNINILVLPANYISNEQATEILEAFLNAKFKEGRHAERLQMLDLD